MHLCTDYARLLHNIAGLRMQKRERQQKILGLIQAKPIGTQEDLRSLLEISGVPATQSSVSRDLEELGVVKQRGHYTLPTKNGPATRGLLSLDHAGEVLVVARTVPGLASAVAVEIDAAAIPEIVGTIAGEDTIFIAVREEKAQRTTIKKIWKLFER
jgi:transcriptional regulator of arginine metabolism